MNTTINLLQSIGYPTESSEFMFGEPKDSTKLRQCSIKNKISALYAQRLLESKAKSQLSPEISRKPSDFATLQDTLTNVCTLLENHGFKYAVVKTPLEFPADFSDIDILVPQEELERAIRTLQESGYTELASSPSSADYRDPNTQFTVDIQNDFTLRKVVYFPGDLILTHSIEETNNRVQFQIPSPATQICLIAIHSLTEQLYTLRDFYHILSLFQKLDWNQFQLFNSVIRTTGLQGAMSAILPLTEQLSRSVFGRSPSQLQAACSQFRDYGVFEHLKETNWSTPFRYRASTLAATVAHKLRDPIFRQSAISEIEELFHPEHLRWNLSQIIKRQRRETY